MILDLAGYTSERDIAAGVAVEPSCGAGAFLVPMVERLARSCAAHGRALGEAAGALVAYDIAERNVDLARKADRLVGRHTGNRDREERPCRRR